MRKKILLVNNKLRRAGVPSFIMTLVRDLSSDYIFDIVVFTDNKDDYDDEFLSFGGRIIRVKKYYGKSKIKSLVDFYTQGRRMFYAVDKAIDKYGPYEAIHCNNTFTAGPFLKAAAKHKIKTRISHNHTVITKDRIWREAVNHYHRKLILKNATLLISCSEAAGKSMFGGKAEVVLINIPYDDKRFDPKKHLMADTDRIVLTQIGYFSKNKNQLFSIEVFKYLLKFQSDAVLNLVGFDKDGTKELIKKQLQGSGLKEQIILHDSDADTPLLLSKSSGFIFPSHQEGFGTVLVEAQAMGVQCYVSDTVPRVSDVGGCRYLPLSSGARAWAEFIIEEYKKTHGRHMQYDCSAFSSKKARDAFCRLYKSGKF